MCVCILSLYIYLWLFVSFPSYFPLFFFLLSLLPKYKLYSQGSLAIIILYSEIVKMNIKKFIPSLPIAMD